MSNKIWGGVVGVVPVADLALQHFVIKKNAVKKVGEIFGIDVTFIDEENDKKEKKREKEDNSSYIHEINGEKELEETTENKVINGFRCFEGISSCTSGGVSLVKASTSAIKAVDLTAKATELGVKTAQLTVKAADYTAKAAQLAAEAATEAKNMDVFSKIFYAVTKITPPLSKAASTAGVQAVNAVEEAASVSISATSVAQKAAAISSSASLYRYASVGFLGFGIVLGVGLGGYFTHKFCEELLDKFVDYYKKNADKLANSYKNAVNNLKINNILLFNL